MRIFPSACSNGNDKVICIGVEGCIEGAVQVKPGDAVSRDAANSGKSAPYQDLPVGLRDGIDTVICIGVKGCIGGTVCVEPGYVVSRGPPMVVKSPPTGSFRPAGT